MDYAFASLLRHHDARLTKVQSYDIVCQWCRKIVQRLKLLPPMLRLNLVLHIIYFVVPKLHIYGHQILCQLLFSLNWLWGAGRTDGEGIERPWAHMGPVATSTRDMGPGSRHDTMDDHWGHWNWVKLVGLGNLLLKRLLNALSELIIHQRALKEFTEQQGDICMTWEKMVKEWEGELSLHPDERQKKNPYEIPNAGMSESEVRLQLMTAEAAQEAAGAPSVHNVSPTVFVSQGLDLEEQQRHLRLDLAKNRFETANQKTTLLQRRMKLLRAIGRFRSMQATYMPAALRIIEKADPKQEHAEQVQLYLPSDLPPAHRSEGCHPGLVDIEQKLREAQLRNALNELRNHLHMKSRLLTYRKSNVAHQGMVRRSQALFLRNEKHIDNAKLKYQAAWNAMYRLVGPDSVKWRKLLESDVRLMDDGDRAVGVARKKKSKKEGETVEGGILDSEEEEVEVEVIGTDEAALQDRAMREVLRGQTKKLKDARKKVGEGKRLPPSWIWTQGGTGDLVDNKVLEEGIRVEWCKAYSRAKRWEEEVVLLKEEMRRCLVTLEYNARLWEDRREYQGALADGKTSWKEEWRISNEYGGPLERGSDQFHQEGVRAYAERQADLYRGLRKKFESLWIGVSDSEDAAESSGTNSKVQEDEDPDDDEEYEGTDEEVEREVEYLAEEDAEEDFD
ncbi:hypothetical protein VKT23_008435 [Stygiomarasmius scandens]|uniref:Uncharacterized protein n=1 Tax=Marasmiellus scandens TaxID=2682957 RepID=A0ABR1JL37_9AGAR